ncbi:restriction endonuclease subunit S [uncultured Pontibacter sp.]|uniref:restriction endonuclease subunit S n=1 Tax=uncultured Pontibacter sp. TaxID=453356 RepID=UPI00261AFE0B|nr:restriction endonuclease subunit S [uncultured Pontibacter sp.]
MNKVKKQLQKSGISFIPEGWEYGTVADYFILGRGRVISQEEVSKNPGVYPVYSSQSANNGEMGKIDTYDFEGEKITWTTDGAYAGTVFYRDGKYNCTNVCGVLTAKESNKIHYGYFAYLLSTIAKRYVSYIGNPKLMNDVFSTIGIVIPPYNEQKKITRILRTVDGQIKKTEATIKKYKAIKQGLMQDLFARGIDVATAKLRPRFQDAPELYKPSPLGMIPKEWDIDAVQTLCSKVTDGAHFSPKPLDYGYRIGNVKDMTDYGFDYEGMTKISQKDFQELARQNCSPKKGDVLLSKDGTIGRVIVFNDDEQVVLLSSIAILTPYEHINSTYLGYLFKTSYFDVQLYQLQSGSALKRLVLSDIRKIKFPTPKDRKEQELIASRLERADKLLEEEMDHRHKIQQIKKGLMSDLLSGKVRVQVDEEAVY